MVADERVVTERSASGEAYTTAANANGRSDLKETIFQDRDEGSTPWFPRKTQTAFKGRNIAIYRMSASKQYKAV
jgi:hypothetical protein